MCVVVIRLYLIVLCLYIQFVPFRNFVSKQRGRDAVVGSAQLARFVLAEVPDQFLQYMYAHAIEPKVPVTNSTS